MKTDFTLDYPVARVGLPALTTLSLRRPKVRDLRALQSGAGSDADRSLRMIANLAEVEPDVIDELDPVDMAKINAWLEPILDPKGPPQPGSGG